MTDIVGAAQPIRMEEGGARRRPQPRVDVVVPCYNYAHFLPRCVASILDQPGVDVRVLVIDDCSSDETADVVAALMAADERVHGRRHAVNEGHIATYNEGLLEWAEAEFSVLISADDMLAPGALARAAAVFGSDSRIGLVYGRGVYFTDHDDLPRVPSLPLGVSRWSGRDWLEGRCRAGHNVISSPEVVVRTSVQQSVGGYRPEFPHAGDLEMWLRIAAVSDIAYMRGRPSAYYRIHDKSMFRTRFNSATADMLQRSEVYERFCRDHRGVLPDTDRLWVLAGRALAREALWKVCRAYDHGDAGRVPEDELVEFALDVCPEATRLREYAALERRRRWGPRFCRRTQIFLGPALVKRGRNLLWWQTWKWRGV